jgi:hypothetical protein
MCEVALNLRTVAQEPEEVLIFSYLLAEIWYKRVFDNFSLNVHLRFYYFFLKLRSFQEATVMPNEHGPMVHAQILNYYRGKFAN